MKIKNKKAQYYLMAAAIIIAVILGVSTVTNYITTKKKPMKFYDLGEELKEEAARVMDYGIYNGENINNLMQNFIEDFIEYAAGNNINIDIDFIFVYGNGSGIQIVIYTNDTLDTGRMSYETLFEDSEADYSCIDETKDIINRNDENVLLKNCTVTGIGEAVQATRGNLKIISSNITGTVMAKEGANLELVDSTVGEKVETKGNGGNIFIINNIIGDKLMIKGDTGTIFITDNTIQGGLTIENCDEIYQIDNNAGSVDTGLCINKVKNNIKIDLSNITYDFNLNEEKNFLFIMTKESDGEIYIVEGEL